MADTADTTKEAAFEGVKRVFGIDDSVTTISECESKVSAKYSREVAKLKEIDLEKVAAELYDKRKAGEYNIPPEFEAVDKCHYGSRYLGWLAEADERQIDPDLKPWARIHNLPTEVNPEYA